MNRSISVFVCILISTFIVSSTYVPVYVMLPLDAIKDNKVTNPDQLDAWFYKLKNDGQVDGVMTDVWWGLVESNPGQYDWHAYAHLFNLTKKNGLKIQTVMSFHKCGGNVGDTCDIPLPYWTRNVSNFYTDQHGNVDEEYLSWGVDNLPYVGGRTAVQVYSDFMTSFKNTFSDILGSVITEIQVGLGPAGELRYPSYQLDKWQFPGIGEFQCYDRHILRDLAISAQLAGHSNWGYGGPGNAGNYNNWPDQTGFFNPNCNCENFASDYGQFFLNWYTQRLIEHGDRILFEASRIFSGKVGIAAKISGIHWQFNTPSHAAEQTAGYKNDKGTAYQPFANMFKKHGATMIFTCLEMSNNEQNNCNCNPVGLVGQTMEAAKNAGIPYSGENALPRYDQTAYNQILWEAKRVRPLHAFTYLRLGDTLFQNDNWNRFKGFVYALHNL
eukprot:TRINITY_DN5884_c0_g1_i1.p1 TRINITY_DN5884_c0_g1~~TRINITY_DN5884_c0_g1_i1.p1  ORF type:complete len:441 (-),score=67.11 TRINITY_DN5884_c0_g1_i1:21-1343(-)